MPSFTTSKRQSFCLLPSPNHFFSVLRCQSQVLWKTISQELCFPESSIFQTHETGQLMESKTCQSAYWKTPYRTGEITLVRAFYRSSWITCAPKPNTWGLALQRIPQRWQYSVLPAQTPNQGWGLAAQGHEAQLPPERTLGQQEPEQQAAAPPDSSNQRQTCHLCNSHALCFVCKVCASKLVQCHPNSNGKRQVLAERPKI